MLAQTGRLGPWLFFTDGAVLCPPLFSALTWDPSGRELLGSYMPSGNDNMSIHPRTGEARRVSTQVSNWEGPDPSRIFFGDPVLPLSQQRPSGISFLLEEGGAHVTSGLGVIESRVGKQRRAVGDRPYFCCCSWLHLEACGILVPQSRIEPRHLAMRAQSPDHWTTREFPTDHTLKKTDFSPSKPFCYAILSRSVVSDSLQPHGLYPTRLLCPWDSPGKNTGVGCHALLQGIFPTQGSNPGLPHCRQILYHLSHQGNLSVQFSLVAQSCPTLCNPMNRSTPGPPPRPSPTPGVHSNSCPSSW